MAVMFQGLSWTEFDDALKDYMVRTEETRAALKAKTFPEEINGLKEITCILFTALDKKGTGSLRQDELKRVHGGDNSGFLKRIQVHVVEELSETAHEVTLGRLKELESRVAADGKHWFTLTPQNARDENVMDLKELKKAALGAEEEWDILLEERLDQLSPRVIWQWITELAREHGVRVVRHFCETLIKNIELKAPIEDSEGDDEASPVKLLTKQELVWIRKTFDAVSFTPLGSSSDHASVFVPVVLMAHGGDHRGLLAALKSRSPIRFEVWCTFCTFLKQALGPTGSLTSLLEQIFLNSGAFVAMLTKYIVGGDRDALYVVLRMCFISSAGDVNGTIETWDDLMRIKRILVPQDHHGNKKKMAGLTFTEFLNEAQHWQLSCRCFEDTRKQDENDVELAQSETEVTDKAGSRPSSEQLSECRTVFEALAGTDAAITKD